METKPLHCHSSPGKAEGSRRETGKEGGGERKGEKEKGEEEQAVKTHSQASFHSLVPPPLVSFLGLDQKLEGLGTDLLG